MGLQISNYTKQKAKDVAIYGGIGLTLLTALLSISTAIANYAAPELTKPLVDLFKGEKNFTLAVSSFISISLALAVLGMAYLICNHKPQILELTVKKDGDYFIVTDEGLKKLNLKNDDQAIIFTDCGDRIMIKNDDDVYVITSKEDNNFLNLKDNEETKLKIYQPNQSLQDTQVINAIAHPAQTIEAAS